MIHEPSSSRTSCARAAGAAAARTTSAIDETMMRMPSPPLVPVLGHYEQPTGCEEYSRGVSTPRELRTGARDARRGDGAGTMTRVTVLRALATLVRLAPGGAAPPPPPRPPPPRP